MAGDSSLQSPIGNEENGEGSWTLPRCSPSSSMAVRLCRSQIASGVWEDILNVSPRLTYHNPTIQIERRPLEASIPRIEEAVLSRSSSGSNVPTEILVSKRTAELVEEIASLETEVVNLERYLLSLYRSLFDASLSNFNISVSHRSSVGQQESFLDQNNELQITNGDNSVKRVESKDLACLNSDTEKDKATKYRGMGFSPARDMVTRSNKSSFSSPRKTPKNARKEGSGSRSLVDHLGALLTDHVPDIACRLSEDIVRCIASAYCRLADPPTRQSDRPASCFSSVSTSGTQSPKDPCDSWSPSYRNGTAAVPRTFHSEIDRRNSEDLLVDIRKMNTNGNRLEYTSKMLSIFRSLVRRLETIDPLKMTKQEQLAFWINIHNALVMHAFLAFGAHQNHMKRMHSVLKAAYNVGGIPISVCIIQNSILRCQPHHQSRWLRTLLSPAIKLMKGMNDKHPYALGIDVPLCHFALSMGTYSDPAVRVYTGKGVFEELKLAMVEFIRWNAAIHGDDGRKILLPKLLHHYARDASVELPYLLEIVVGCMPEIQRVSLLEGFVQGKMDKCVEWSSCRPSFRYLIHGDVTKQ